MHPSFYVLEPVWWGPDRFFKLFVTARYLCGAYLAGQIFDEASADQITRSAQPLGFLAAPFVRRALRLRREREGRADSVDPESDGFIDLHRHNFRIEVGQIERIAVFRKRSLWTMGGAVNSGSVQLHLFGGKRRKFLLMGTQAADRAAALLKERIPSTDVDPGTSSRN